MANYTIIGGDGKEYGSVSADSLRKWIVEGRLSADSLAKGEGDAEFRPLSTFPEFADAFAPPVPDPAEPPPLASAMADDGHTAALQRVKAPAVALKITALLNILFGVWALVRAFFPPDMQEFDSQLQQLNNPQLQQLFDKWIHIAYGPLGMVSDIFGLILSVLILMGAVRMQFLRNYEFSLTAAILAMLPCMTPCCIIGLPFGIWALVVLRSPEVKSHFH